MSGGKIRNTLAMLKGRLTKEFIITTVAQCLYLLQNVIQNKIFTSCFSVEVFGQWSLIVSVYTFISMLPFSALDQGVYRNTSACRDKGSERQLYSLIAFTYFGGFALYTVIFVILNAVQGSEFFANRWLLLFLAYSFTEILKNTYVVIDNSYRNRGRVLAVRVFGIVSRTALFIAAYYLGLFTMRNVLLILVVTNVVILLYQGRYILGITFKLDKAECKRIVISILKFSSPLLAWAIFGWMQNMISRWYLDALLDKSVLAMYSVLTTLSYFVPNAVYTVLSAYVMPIVFSKNKPFTRRSLFKYVASVTSVLLVYWAGVTVFGKYLILFLTDAKYLGILKYLPITTMSAILYYVAMLSTIEIYRQGKTNRLILSTITPGLLMATVGYFLIREFGMNGAVINYVMGQVVYAVLTFLVAFNKKNIENNNKQIERN